MSLVPLVRFHPDVRHRDYFLPIQSDDPDAHALAPGGKTTVLSAGLLVVSLLAIVALAKILTLLWSAE